MDEVAKRVSAEHDELNEKITKLRAYVNSQKFTELAQAHQNLLCKQLDSMCAYSDILAARLRLFNSTHEDIDWEEWDTSPEAPVFNQLEEHTSGVSVDWLDGFREVETCNDV